ncbi:MAG: sensor histidine kinase [Acidiferrobacteraceae bacterium]
MNTTSDKDAPAKTWGNLDRPPATWRILILAELLAILFTVVRNSRFDIHALHDFEVLSGFWITTALAGGLGLKLVSRSGRSVNSRAVFLTLLVLLLAIIAAVTEGVIAVLYQLGDIHHEGFQSHLSLLVRALLAGGLIGGIGLKYLVVAERFREGADREQELRMQALQSRIRPHFLFNSMNSIASLTRTDPSRAEAALQDLADLFRVLLADARKLVPMSAEREISRQYLEIEKLRLGDRLKVNWNVSNVPRNALIPALTLQPLLENAIYHGIEPRFGGGTVRIDLWTESEQRLNVLISNPLPETPGRAHGKGNRIALDNLRQRLETYFGAEATLQTFEEGGQYHVKVKMPIMRG